MIPGAKQLFIEKIKKNPHCSARKAKRPIKKKGEKKKTNERANKQTDTKREKQARVSILVRAKSHEGQTEILRPIRLHLAHFHSARLLRLPWGSPVPPYVIGRSWRRRPPLTPLTKFRNSVLPLDRVTFVCDSQVFSSSVYPAHFTSNSAIPPRSRQFTMRSTSYSARQPLAMCTGGAIHLVALNALVGVCSPNGSRVAAAGDTAAVPGSYCLRGRGYFLWLAWYVLGGGVKSGYTSHMKGGQHHLIFMWSPLVCEYIWAVISS